MNTLIRTLVLFCFLQVTAAATATPPALIADSHVPLGCVPDALVYIARLAEARPDLSARLLRMQRRNEEHVMALITAADGRLFARDEYVGILDLATNESDGLSDEQLAKRALAAHAAAERKNPYTSVRAAETRMQLRDAAAKVAAMIGPEARLFKTSDGAFVIWPARSGEMHVYSGDRGTMTIAPRAGIAADALAAALAKGLGQGALVN